MKIVDDMISGDVPKYLESLRAAIEAEDARKVGKLVDFFRFVLGMKYVDILALVKRARPETTAAEWDELLAETDRLESLG